MESTQSGGKGREISLERQTKMKKVSVDRPSTRRRTRRATACSRCPGASEDRADTERQRPTKRSASTRPSLYRRKASCPEILLSRQDFTKMTLQGLVKLVKIGEVDLETLALVGKFPLHDAVARGFVEIVRSLVGHLRNINLPSREGLTPLEVAVQTGNFECAELLITHGASMVDIQDGFNRKKR